MRALLRKIRQILRDRKTRRIFTRLVSTVAAIVVFVTTYALVLPAITMESEAACGIEAHQHDQSCFTDDLVCEIPESSGHVHDDSCYQKVLTCGKEVHTHSAACYHVDTASQAATEAIAVASTESAAAAETENAMGDTDSLNAPVENNEPETGLDSSTENSVIEGSLDGSTDNSVPGGDLNPLTDEVSGSERGAWTSTEAAADATASTAASTEASVGATAGITATPESTAGETATTATSTGAADATSASAGYVPVLDELNFNTLLNKNTGIYYSRIADSDSALDNENDGADAASNTEDAQVPATWNRIDKHTELKESDNLRLYLAYTIPAGSLNETNQTARYTLPGNIHLTDEQVVEINTTVNGIAGQYVSYDTLEILDQEMYGKYLGVETIEGTRTPSDDLNEYLANNEGQEFISATVKVENVLDENTGLLKAQDLVFTFAPYTIQKNQHQYDSEGKPTKAGGEVNGWLAIDISTEQIDWEKADDGAQTADIIFVEKDKKSDLKEISSELMLVETEADSDVNTKKTADADSTDSTDPAATDNKQDGTKDSEAADGELDKEAEKEQVNYPDVSFDDSITVTGGSLSTDTGAVSGDAGMAAETEITVHVEADKNTFPEGTTMILSAVPDEQMTTVAEAVEGAVDAPKTMGFHAVDISFRDVKGNEIEPLKPIRVSMTSDAIKRAVEDKSTAPVVVHVSDIAADVPAEERNTDNGDSKPAAVADEYTDDGDSEPAAAADEGADDGEAANVTDSDEVEGAADQHIAEPSETSADQAPDNSPDTPATPAATIIETDTVTKENNGDTLTFDAEAFSVYAIVYTVDFHYEVNGKMYEFSIPGGGFVSLEHVVEVLGIASTDENTGKRAENNEKGAENEDDFLGEVPGVDESGENEEGRMNATDDDEFSPSSDSTTYEEAIKLNEVEVSEATRKFVAGVESVEFSNPELVWAGKCDEAITVGGIKETKGLEVEYSAELTEEQIVEINAQTVEAGDWALISLIPFESEENLTVTMKDGEVFTIRVTDAQISTHVITADGKDFIITVTYGDDAQIPDGAKLEAEEILPDKEAFNEYLTKSLEAVCSDEENGNMTAARLEDGDVSEEVSDSQVSLETDGDILNAKSGKEDLATESSISGYVEMKQETVVDFARFFDIRIMADGKKIEPAAPVEVKVTYTESLNMDQDEDLHAVHFGENGTEVLEAVSDEDNKSVIFTQDSFSVTGTIITSNNEWPSSNGKYYMYVQQGGNYYAVAHDGSLTPVTVNNGKIIFDDNAQINVDDYAWSYEAQTGGVWWNPTTNYYVFYRDGSSDVYLDPGSDSGLNAVAATVNLSRDDQGHIRIPNSSNYIGMQNGSIAGKKSQTNAVPIQFAQIQRTLTVHFVDREGHEFDDVSFIGDESLPVTRNDDGTFSIPYDWGDLTELDSIDLRTDFSKTGYTYANSHLAGTRVAGEEIEVLTHDGLVIDAKLTERNHSLYYSTDRSENRKYGSLDDYSFYGSLAVPKNYTGNGVNSTLSGDGGRTLYSRSDTDKDVYVILDPEPNTSQGSSGGAGNDSLNVNDPVFKKTLVKNEDGTYTLSLSVTGNGKNTSANSKANVVFVVDTSSSMVSHTTNTGNTRLEDTKDEVASFARKLLNVNSAPGRDSNTIEISMVSFDGGVVTNRQWYTTYDGNDGFSSQVDTLTANNMHTGTDWEDGLNKALELAADKQSEKEPTYVIFFTDGEPSQYTSFHGAGENGGQTRGYRYWYSYFLSREAAKDEARAIVNAGLVLYTIYAYNPPPAQQNPPQQPYVSYYGSEGGVEFLHNLTRYAYNTPQTESQEGKTFFPVDTTSDLKNALASILNSINEYVGITDVEVTDNITSLTRVGITGVGDSATGFTYTRSGGRYGTAEQPWTEEDTTPPPHAVYYPEGQAPEGETAGVHWDLSTLGLLEDGVTYKVSFTVWPSQDAYDWVADLNNGIRTWEQVQAAGLDSHFIELDDPTRPSGHRYEVATNPPSKKPTGEIINNEITYKKTHRETVASLPDGVTSGVPVVETDPITGTKTTTTYSQNQDGTYTKTVVTEAVTAFGPPDLNMGLDNSVFKVRKKWNVSRPYELVNFLYNTTTGQPLDDSKNIDFEIIKGTDTTPYSTVTLGYDAGEDPEDPSDDIGFVWADEPQTVTVHEGTEHEREFEVGSIWEKPLDIPFGLMLTPEMAAERNLDLTDTKYIPVYASEEDAENNTNILYYVLEKGHDYNIKEPALDYRFDFVSEPLHPMLLNDQPEDVQPKPRDVKLEYKTIGGREKAILISISDDEEDISALTGENVLRGELTVKKNILDEDGNEDTSDAVKAKVFQLTVTLTNTEDAPFYNIPGNPHEQNVPWYGIQGSDEESTLYYHKNNEDGTFAYYCNEREACVDGDFTNGIKVDEGYEGNVMTESQDYTTATAVVYVHPWETWTITNIPGGTTYEIEENPDAAYKFVKAEEIDSDNLVQAPSDPFITGTVTANSVTNVEFTNQFKPGALKFTKIVKIKSGDGYQDPTQDQWDLVDGDYIFTVVSTQGVTPPVSKYVQITVFQGTAVSYKVAESEAALSEVDAEEGAWAILTGLAEGDYVITETAVDKGLVPTLIARGDGNTQVVDMEHDCVTVHVTSDDVSAENSSAQASFTNSYFINDGPDKIVIDIEKIFYGIASAAHIPEDFQLMLKYKIGTTEYTLPLNKHEHTTYAGDHDEIVQWTQSGDGENGFVWHWHVSNIDGDAKNFEIKEENYSNIPGYEWLNQTTLDGQDWETPNVYHILNVTAPSVQLNNVTDERITPDNNKNYRVYENDVILVSLTGEHGEHGTLVISQESLNKRERDAISAVVGGTSTMLDGHKLQGSWKIPCYFFSIADHPEGFFYKDHTVTFTEGDEEYYIVHVDHPQSSMEEVFVVSFNTEQSLNSADITNTYEENEVSLEILKVDLSPEKIRLPGAVFTLRKLDEPAVPTNNGTFSGEEVTGSPFTSNASGSITISGLKHGCYELKEIDAPAGYVLTGSTAQYFRIDAGTVTWIEWQKAEPGAEPGDEPESAPEEEAESGWIEKTSDNMVSFENATFTVKNEPGAALPNTGGPGTNMLYFFGIMLAGLAGTGLVMKRRRRKNVA